jgi:hypothetical protein
MELGIGDEFTDDELRVGDEAGKPCRGHRSGHEVPRLRDGVRLVAESQLVLDDHSTCPSVDLYHRQ